MENGTEEASTLDLTCIEYFNYENTKNNPVDFARDDFVCGFL
jgi:hypothetical protein